jgi:hypothetical protein
MEHFWDFLFQLMKHGTNTLHVAYIFLFSVVFERLQHVCVMMRKYISSCIVPLFTLSYYNYFK